MGRKYTLIFLGLLAAAHLAGLAACSKKSTPADTIPPGAPVLLPAPPDSAWDETGADAIPEEDWIQLVWLGRPEPDLGGYRIYRWTPPYEIPTLLDTKTLRTGDNDTTYQDTSVQIGVRYHYQVTALDRTGNESAKSDTVDYMLIPKLSSENLTEPRGQFVERQPIFCWTSTGESMANHLRVYDFEEKQTVWVSSGHNPFSSPHAVLYNDDGTATQSLLISGRKYQWRVDRQGSALRSGSESNWVSFSVR